MSPNEVLEKLQKLTVIMSRQTLARYERQGLIPAPKRGGAGRGGGRWTDYPDETVAEAYASWSLIHGAYMGEKSKSIFTGSPPKISPEVICLARGLCFTNMRILEQNSEGDLYLTEEISPLMGAVLLNKLDDEDKDLFRACFGDFLGKTLEDVSKKERLLLMWLSIVWRDELYKARQLLKTIE